MKRVDKVVTLPFAPSGVSYRARGAMASHAVAACVPPLGVADRRSEGHHRGGGNRSARGFCSFGGKRHRKCRPVWTDISVVVCASPRKCDLYDVSDDLTPYHVAWGWQKAILEARLASLSLEKDETVSGDDTHDEEGDTNTRHPLGHRDCVLLVQHPAVVTLGTGSSLENLKFDPGAADAPFQVFRTERGGEATYHGPGQLVLYPILDLSQRTPDLHKYMRDLEQVAILAMTTLGVRNAGRVAGLTGAWGTRVPDDETGVVTENEEAVSEDEDGVNNSQTPHKVAAIGVRARRWVTYHGVALNVDVDLSQFQYIVPCGIGDRPVGSVAQLLLGKAGIVSSSSGSTDPQHDSNLDSAGARGVGADAKGPPPDAELMERAKEALLDAFQVVFETELVNKEGPPFVA